MLYKQIILLALSVVFIFVFFNIDTYSNWLDRFLLNPDIKEQFGKLDVKERYEDRFGSVYILIEVLHARIDTSKDKENVILLPPNAYIRSQRIENFNLPEPAVFYYLSGLKTVWTTSPEVGKANWAIVAVAGKGLNIIKLTDTNELHQLLDMYKNFKPDL